MRRMLRFAIGNGPPNVAGNARAETMREARVNFRWKVGYAGCGKAHSFD
jgi:hypothetical protein